ncbi:MAG: type II toxin-antitoxin system VapC family toxin [Bacteroidetes bacterium]|nr:type II toxin-antitoxin system VapC family toxin [Bacteroidota bacterium]
MNLYVDSSALVKHFHEEQGSEKVTELLNDASNEIWISELVIIEFYSALFRRFRNKEIDEEELETAIQGFEEYIKIVIIEPLRPTIVKEAERLLKQYGRNYGLRTLDALQLGTFNLIAKEDWTFLGADTKFNGLLRDMNFSVINPMD